MKSAFPELERNFGFGMMRLPMKGEDVDLEQTRDMVDAFLKAGFRYFDTAHPYIQGKSELAVRDCLANRYPRSEFLLANKLSRNYFETGEEIRPLVLQQLELCGVEYFDFYLMHAMSAERHAFFQSIGAYDVVQTLKVEGKLRHVGLSFHDSAQVLDQILTDRPEMEFVQLQFNYVDLDDPKVQARACWEVCRKHGKPVFVMEPVKGGSLVNLPEKAREWMTEYSPAGYAIRFCAGYEGIAMVLSGMSTMEQMEDNLKTMTNFVPFSRDEEEMIGRVRTMYQAQHRIPCTACRYCTDGCPAGIPIPDVFACFNDKRQGQGQPEEDFRALDQGPDACVGCGQCEEVCPQHLAIRELLRETAATFATEA